MRRYAQKNENLEQLHVDVLRERAKEQEIPHASSMRKKELIEALQRGGERAEGGDREDRASHGHRSERRDAEDERRPEGKTAGIAPGENPTPGKRDD